jgi:hypothetical protein
MLSRLWHPSSWLLGQEVHFFVGMLLPSLFQAKGLPAWIGAVVILLVAALKELTFDAKIEGQKTEGSLVDLFFYLVGAVAALVVLW